MNNHQPQNYDCPFCRLLDSEEKPHPDIVYQTAALFACMSLHHQQHSGPTVLIIPKQHIENLYDMPDDLLALIFTAAKLIASTMHTLWHTQGITLWQHNEPCGSQDVWLFHLHVKSRLANDNLYASQKVKTENETRW